MNYLFNFQAALAYWPVFLWGAWLTLKLSTLSMLLGLVIGVVLALAERSSWRLALARRRLWRGDPQHAVSGSNLHHLLWSASFRHPVQSQYSGVDRPVAEYRRVLLGNPARRHRQHQPRSDQPAALWV